MISPAYLKKKDDRIPCAALLTIRSMVAFECPWKISKLPGPEKIQRKHYRIIFLIPPWTNFLKRGQNFHTGYKHRHICHHEGSQWPLHSYKRRYIHTWLIPKLKTFVLPLRDSVLWFVIRCTIRSLTTMTLQ